jgi:23S rRNA (uracil1939-C5)-methyltransferase
MATASFCWPHGALGVHEARMTEHVSITGLAAQGHGEAVTAGGAPLFVPFSLPGETVEIERAGDRGRLLNVLTPSPERQEPVCPHFGRCGGCALQHAAPALYQSFKRNLVIAAFGQRGLTVAPEPLITIPMAARRRAVFSARRGRSGVLLGFHAEGEAVIIPITACPILSPALSAALPDLARLAECLASHRRDVRLSVTETATGLAVEITDARRDLNPAERERASVAASQPRFARVTVMGEVLAQRAEPVVMLAGVPVALPPGAFLQATVASERAMTELVLAAVGEGSAPVADLFAGLGTFALALARGSPVTAVESDPAALAALIAAARRAPSGASPVIALKPVTSLRRDLLREPLGAAELKGYRAVVFDPPRAGAAAQAARLAESIVPVVVAVSCNPATLARDARTLIDGGYQLERLTPIDQFVFSPHVEVVAVFRRPQNVPRRR